MRRSLLIATALLGLPLGAAPVAQHADHVPPAKDRPSTSTLSPDAVQQLLNGDGMGLARPAELNGYPGPKHVLELKGPLGITPEQEARVEAIRQQMLEQARPLGRSILDAERALDEAFSSERITPQDLAARTAAIAELQGQLRRVHLQAHLLTRPLLSNEQVAKYGELRRAHH